jgi:hypothetical protein
VLSPDALITVGALGATLSALSSARASARLALTLIPCALGLSAALSPELLDSWGWAQGASEPLAVTLRLSSPSEGLKVLAAPLHVTHPLGEWLANLAALTGGLALVASWAKRIAVQRLALGAWALGCVVWLLGLYPSPGAWASLTSGEAAVREWLLSAEGVNPQQLTSFVTPQGAWRWAPAHLSLALLGLVSASLGAWLPARSEERELEGGARRVYLAGALVALIGAAWHLTAHGGFVASTAVWVPVLALMVGAELTRNAAQAALLATLALGAVAL